MINCSGFSGLMPGMSLYFWMIMETMDSCQTQSTHRISRNMPGWSITVAIVTIALKAGAYYPHRIGLAALRRDGIVVNLVAAVIALSGDASCQNWRSSRYTYGRTIKPNTSRQPLRAP